MAIDLPTHAGAADLALIGSFNRTAAPFPDVTLQQLIEDEVERHPERTAVVCEHDRVFGMASLSYGELNGKVNAIAHRLRAEGVRPGDIVALMVERSFAMIIGIFAIIKSGAAYLPLPPENPVERTRYMLQDGNVRVLLVHGKTVTNVVFDGLTIDLDDLDLYRGPTRNPDIANGPRDLAYVIYTSGSTGKPKGVMIEHRSVVNRLHWMQRAYPLGEHDVILQKTPYYFDVSVWELFWWALSGATLCFLMPGGERYPLAIVETIRRARVSVLHFVPSMLNVFLEYVDAKRTVISSMASLRRVFASGEALAPAHVRRFNELFVDTAATQLVNLYGPTEATVDVTYFDCPRQGNIDRVPIGRPIDNVRLYVLRDGRPVPIGETGELCIAGVGLARGYLNNRGLTDEKFTDNPANPGERIYRTGDVARWLPDGNVEYLGREDNQVKIRGLRIELGEIENTIREYPGVADCVAVVKVPSTNIAHIVVYMVCKSVLGSENLLRYVKERLPDYMVPNRFIQIEEMPLTSSGKADRKALLEPVLSRAS